MKRPATEPANDAVKRPKTQHHKIRHVQQWEADPLLASQDSEFFRTQLLRSVTLALSAAGFDSAKPSALEQLMALAENFMDRFLLHVRTAMTSARRTTPTAQDFILALAHTSPSSAALLPHVVNTLPATVTLPHLSRLPPDEPPVSNLDSILGPALTGPDDANQRPWIPKHLPALPSRHAWQSTPVFATRETDALKVRERATEGGVQAEKSLRRLAKAEKEGLTRIQKARGKSRKQEKSNTLWERAMEGMKRDDETARRREEEADSFGFGLGGANDASESARRTRNAVDSELDGEDGGRVNWEARYWRNHAASSSARS